ncbi:MAG: 4-(cytidine 5'-diphospho)-2-C-methyl-D-erythritol kinase [Candidatus Omnitrophica bacterium]|nr:4-(cytidine 5'-diphospho)-2-C-methyl-D-erythritol kinase [Candidatus Omnitrophota bacterium]
MRSLRLRAYAKINLYLRVLRTREDGYHDIETLFERISLHDEIMFSAAGDKEIHLDCLAGAYGHTPLLSSGPENLCYRAAEQFKKRFNIQEGVRIQLVKRIPVAAGLGGGSSDAAAVLLGLNQWWKTGASQRELLELGGRIGADVPFFVLGVCRAIGRGRGDILEVGAHCNVPLRPGKAFYLIATPGISVLTKDVYKGWDDLNGLTPSSKNDTINPLVEWVNDLEPVVAQKYPQVREFADLLRRMGLSKIRLSGSGPTFFAEAQSQEDGDRWVQKIKAAYPNCQLFCVEGY